MAQIDVGSSYDAIWPFLVLLGLGMGLAIPAVSAGAMSGVDDDQPGSRRESSSARHVGSTLGIAVLGSISATFARADWHEQLPLLAPETRERAAPLTTLVVGGQGDRIGALAGPPARQAALESFVHGLHGALLTASALAFVAAAFAFVGLRRVRPSAAARTHRRLQDLPRRRAVKRAA